MISKKGYKLESEKSTRHIYNAELDRNLVVNADIFRVYSNLDMGFIGTSLNGDYLDYDDRGSLLIDEMRIEL